MMIGGGRVKRKDLKGTDWEKKFPSKKELDQIGIGSVVAVMDIGSSMEGDLYYLKWVQIDSYNENNEQHMAFGHPSAPFIGKPIQPGIPLNGGPTYPFNPNVVTSLSKDDVIEVFKT